MKGPGIFLAQFMGAQEPFDTLDGLANWSRSLGYVGLQIPTWDVRMLDLDRASTSKGYCEDYIGRLSQFGVEVSELAAPLQGQCLAIHPAYADGFAGMCGGRLDDSERTTWAAGELRKVILASENIGLGVIPTLSGGFAWHLCYPWPPRQTGLIETAFEELARRWRPLLDEASDHGQVFAFEPHPGSDVFDGATFEMFLEQVGDHAAACLNYDPSHLLLQQLDYAEFIRIYGARIKGFHVKDAEFHPNGRMGVYGGYQPWLGRPGRFRSLGDGQVDFGRVFSLLTEAGYSGWAVLEWECCIKSPEQAAAQASQFIRSHFIDRAQVSFDDFAAAPADSDRCRRMLGLQGDRDT